MRKQILKRIAIRFLAAAAAAAALMTCGCTQKSTGADEKELLPSEITAEIPERHGTENAYEADTLNEIRYVFKEDGLAMRETFSGESQELCTLPLDTRITVTEEQNGWSKTYYEGSTGWCDSEYLTELPSTERYTTADADLYADDSSRDITTGSILSGRKVNVVGSLFDSTARVRIKYYDWDKEKMISGWIDKSLLSSHDPGNDIPVTGELTREKALALVSRIRTASASSLAFIESLGCYEITGSTDINEYFRGYSIAGLDSLNDYTALLKKFVTDRFYETEFAGKVLAAEGGELSPAGCIIQNGICYFHSPGGFGFDCGPEDFEQTDENTYRVYLGGPGAEPYGYHSMYYTIVFADGCYKIDEFVSPGN